MLSEKPRSDQSSPGSSIDLMPGSSLLGLLHDLMNVHVDTQLKSKFFANTAGFVIVPAFFIVFHIKRILPTVRRHSRVPALKG